MLAPWKVPRALTAAFLVQLVQTPSLFLWRSLGDRSTRHQNLPHIFQKLKPATLQWETPSLWVALKRSSFALSWKSDLMYMSIHEWYDPCTSSSHRPFPHCAGSLPAVLFQWPSPFSQPFSLLYPVSSYQTVERRPFHGFDPRSDQLLPTHQPQEALGRKRNSKSANEEHKSDQYIELRIVTKKKSVFFSVAHQVQQVTQWQIRYLIFEM